jgi:hypothetical protein
MGGFALDTRDADAEIPGEYIYGSPRIFLGLRATEAVARLGFLPDITQQSIKDMSKADSLAKILAISQASWLILQCIARFATQLAVTTLELNTLAHAACALLVYLLWWEKPLDIQDPTILTGEWVPVVAASLWMCSSPRRRLPVREAGSKLSILRTWVNDAAFKWIPRSELEGLTWTSKELAAQHLTGYIEARTGLSGESFMATVSRDTCSVILLDGVSKTFSALDIGESGADGSTAMVRIYDKPRHVRGILCVFSGIAVHSYRYSLSTILNPFENFSMVDVRRWQLFRCCTRDYPKFVQSFISRWRKDDMESTESSQPQSPGLFHTLDTDCGDNHTFSPPFLRRQPNHCLRPRPASQLVTIRPSNWAFMDGELRSMFVFLLAAVLYGGIHAKAWQGYFPTETERLLWKISAIYVALCGIFIFLALPLWRYGQEDLGMKKIVSAIVHVVLDEIRGWLKRQFHRMGVGSLYDTIERLVLAATGLVLIAAPMLLYCFCRSFLVVEGFVGLRRLPAKAFETPDWPEYLPHL